METYPEYPDWSDKTFLIAEDIDSNYTILAALLKKTHVRILRARNGKEAIQIASGTASIDLILMDISMPDSEIINEKFDGFLLKPIRRKELLETLSKYLS